MTEKSNKDFFGYKAVVGAFLVMFVNLGVCTTLGVFLASLAEYSEWDLGTVGYIGTVNTIGNIILSIVAVKSLDKLGVRKTMLISIIACAAHMCFYCMVTPGRNTMSLMFMYIAGFLASFSITFGTHASCSTIIAKWFIEKRQKLDRECSVSQELEWLKKAGFMHTHCIYTNQKFSVLMAVK